ncbi:uncharacterized protein LOC114804018 isoform X2 [Zeugodacus cucurbitae]|uniref:uncharacterized protein LOC114804018 isoform X2 n=1 Tax=Zeugodacus cucurbitae TaxID=28588 RepID=UPI0023D900DD|nr:uncharacterized protein LOC114804018 isoform X2 [Zeugodacus cucurbitae]
MSIIISVLLATLTIYCGTSVLSLPPSLIGSATSLARQHVRQPRDNSGSDTKTAGTTTILLPQQHIHSVEYPQPLHWQKARPKKDLTSFGLGDGNIATNAYTGRGTSSDDIERLSSMDLDTNNNNSNYAGIKLTHPFKVSGKAADVKDAHEIRSGSGNRKLPDEYDLNAADLIEWQNGNPQQTPQRQQQQLHSAQWWHIQAPRIRAMQMKEFFTPLKYWAHHCQPPDHNCPQEYYRALFADRSRAAAAVAKLMDDFTASDSGDAKVVPPTTITDDDVNINVHAFAKNGDGSGFDDSLRNINDDDAVDNAYSDVVAEIANGDGSGDADDDDEDNNAGNDILMLLSGEQDVMKFLSWAMEQLYPHQHFAQLNGSRQAEYYHPGMFNWKKLNLSGHLEPPLMVEEPNYVIVRREQLEDDQQTGSQYKDDPFIPPRGRKHNLPDLDALLNRYETFVPNRGKRDKIKDIFKYDDLFFPNRGKKQKPPKAATLFAANEVDAVDEPSDTNVDVGGQAEGKKALLLDNQVDDSDDNSNNYSDTDDSSSGNEEEASAIGWPTRNALLKTQNYATENSPSTKLSIPQIKELNNFLDLMAQRSARMSRLRRVASTFGGITQIAANRLRSMPTMTNSAERQQSKNVASQLRQHHAQRRGGWQLPLPSNQVRTNVNGLDILTWLQQQSKQHQDSNNKPLLQEQIQQPRWQKMEQHRPQRLFGGADGVAAGRSSLESTGIGGI